MPSTTQNLSIAYNARNDWLISASTTGSASVVVAGVGEYAAFVVQWENGTGLSAGVVTIEASADPSYAGTWAPLATVAYVGATNHCDIVNLTGTFLVLRARISTTVVGGTVSVYFAQSGD